MEVIVKNHHCHNDIKKFNTNNNNNIALIYSPSQLGKIKSSQQTFEVYNEVSHPMRKILYTILKNQKFAYACYGHGVAKANETINIMITWCFKQASQ